MKTYQAPWGRPLKWVSSLLVMLAVTVAVLHLFPEGMPRWSVGRASWIIPAVVLGCLPFIVRGYEIAGDAILIRRLFWTTRLPLEGMKSAEYIPKAMSNSLRTFGNGGGFSITGWYWNKVLGHYRAFVTDNNRTVVLKFDKRTVVISPDAPEEFVIELNR